MGFHKKPSVSSIWNFCVLPIVLCCLLTPISALRKYGESCTSGQECESGRCSLNKRTCACTEVRTRASKAKVYQIYNTELGKCLSQVGQLCTLETADPDLKKIECIPGAFCDPSLKRHSEISFCACKPSYELRDDRCLSQLELRRGKGLSPMNQRDRGGWNSGGSSSSKLGKPYIMTPYISIFLYFVLSSQFV